jgi:hypothetical protein
LALSEAEALDCLWCSDEAGRGFAAKALRMREKSSRQKKPRNFIPERSLA